LSQEYVYGYPDKGDNDEIIIIIIIIINKSSNTRVYVKTFGSGEVTGRKSL